MTPEREQEIRALAAGLLRSRRHGKIGRVVQELLDELDRTRGRLDEALLEAAHYEERYFEGRVRARRSA